MEQCHRDGAPKSMYRHRSRLLERCPTNLLKQATCEILDLYKRVWKGSSSNQAHAFVSCTNEDGHFVPNCGMLLGSRYVFSTCIRSKGQSAVLISARDTCQAMGSVAIKVMHTSFQDIGLKEVDTLRKLNKGDPDDVSHTIKLLNAFMYDSHVCLVFPLLDSRPLNHVISDRQLRSDQKLKAVRKIAFHLLSALAFLKRSKMIHADLKPENILTKAIPESKDENIINSLTLVDFGNVIEHNKTDISCYHSDFELQTLPYRAPEVCVGREFGIEIDMWSLGCVLAELYIGRILFPGQTRIDVLKKVTQLLGPLPECICNDAKFGSDLEIMALCDERQVSRQKISASDLMSKIPALDDESFASFLLGLLCYHTEKRLTPWAALQHPFMSKEICIPHFFQDPTKHQVNQRILPHANPSDSLILKMGTEKRPPSAFTPKNIARIKPLGHSKISCDSVNEPTDLSVSNKLYSEKLTKEFLYKRRLQQMNSTTFISDSNSSSKIIGHPFQNNLNILEQKTSNSDVVQKIKKYCQKNTTFTVKCNDIRPDTIESSNSAFTKHRGKFYTTNIKDDISTPTPRKRNEIMFHKDGGQDELVRSPCLKSSNYCQNSIKSLLTRTNYNATTGLVLTRNASLDDDEYYENPFMNYNGSHTSYGSKNTAVKRITQEDNMSLNRRNGVMNNTFTISDKEVDVLNQTRDLKGFFQKTIVMKENDDDKTQDSKNVKEYDQAKDKSRDDELTMHQYSIEDQDTSKTVHDDKHKVIDNSTMDSNKRDNKRHTYQSANDEKSEHEMTFCVKNPAVMRSNKHRNISIHNTKRPVHSSLCDKISQDALVGVEIRHKKFDDSHCDSVDKTHTVINFKDENCNNLGSNTSFLLPKPQTHSHQNVFKKQNQIKDKKQSIKSTYCQNQYYGKQKKSIQLTRHSSFVGEYFEYPFMNCGGSSTSDGNKNIAVKHMQQDDPSVNNKNYVLNDTFTVSDKEVDVINQIHDLTGLFQKTNVMKENDEIQNSNKVKEYDQAMDKSRDDELSMHEYSIEDQETTKNVHGDKYKVIDNSTVDLDKRDNRRNNNKSNGYFLDERDDIEDTNTHSENDFKSDQSYVHNYSIDKCNILKKEKCKQDTYHRRFDAVKDPCESQKKEQHKARKPHFRQSIFQKQNKGQDKKQIKSRYHENQNDAKEKKSIQLISISQQRHINLLSRDECKFQSKLTLGHEKSIELEETLRQSEIYPSMIKQFQPITKTQMNLEDNNIKSSSCKYKKQRDSFGSNNDNNNIYEKGYVDHHERVSGDVDHQCELDSQLVEIVKDQSSAVTADMNGCVIRCHLGASCDERGDSNDNKMLSTEHGLRRAFIPWETKEHNEEILPGEHKEDNLPREHKEDNFPREHKEDNLPVEHKEDNLPGEHKEDNLPREHKEDNFPREHKEDNLPVEHKEDNLPREHKEDNLPRVHKEDNLPGEHKEDNLPREHKEDNLPREHKEDNLPREHKEDNLPREHKEDNLPREHKEDNLPRVHKEDNLPREHKEDNLPEEHKEDNLPREHKEDNLPGEHKEDNLPEEHKEDNLPEEHKENNLSRKHKEDNLQKKYMEKNLPGQHMEDNSLWEHKEDDLQREHKVDIVTKKRKRWRKMSMEDEIQNRIGAYPNIDCMLPNIIDNRHVTNVRLGDNEDGNKGVEMKREISEWDIVEDEFDDIDVICQEVEEGMHGGTKERRKESFEDDVLNDICAQQDIIESENILCKAGHQSSDVIVNTLSTCPEVDIGLNRRSMRKCCLGISYHEKIVEMYGRKSSESKSNRKCSQSLSRKYDDSIKQKQKDGQMGKRNKKKKDGQIGKTLQTKKGQSTIKKKEVMRGKRNKFDYSEKCHKNELKQRIIERNEKESIENELIDIVCKMPNTSHTTIRCEDRKEKLLSRTRQKKFKRALKFEHTKEDCNDDKKLHQGNRTAISSRHLYPDHDNFEQSERIILKRSKKRLMRESLLKDETDQNVSDVYEFKVTPRKKIKVCATGNSLKTSDQGYRKSQFPKSGTKLTREVDQSNFLHSMCSIGELVERKMKLINIDPSPSSI